MLRRSSLGLALVLAQGLTLCLIAPLRAQLIGNGNGSSSVSVTAGTPNIVITPSPGVGSFTVGTTNAINTQSGTGAYAVAAGDAGKQILRTNSSGGADTIANATGSFGAGYSTTYTTGSFAGNTITPTTALINGLASLKLGSYQYVGIDSDGSAYHAALGLPQPATQTGTTVLKDDFTWGAPPVTTLAAGGNATLVAPRQYYVCTGACSIIVPAPVAGYEFCVMNDDNVATVITLAAIGSSARYENTARTAYGTAGTGTLVSAGAVGDKVCLLGRDSTHYLTVSFNGTFTAN